LTSLRFLINVTSLLHCVLQTIDCFTRPGCVQLVADTEEEVRFPFPFYEVVLHIASATMPDFGPALVLCC
jgi:hypothetical protein